MPSRRNALLGFRLDLRSRSPAYLQVIRRVRALASAGRLVPGEQLPTVRALAGQLGVNFNTVARAYRWLHRSGLVSAQPGRGTFVLDVRLARRAPHATLQTLASHYIAEARRNRFSDAQIASMIAARLRASGAESGSGDNHG